MKALLLAASAALVIGSVATAEEAYRLPPADVVDIVTRAPSPAVSLSPSKTTLLMLQRESLPPVAELAKPMERLAGLRLDPATNDRHGYRTTVGLVLRDLETGRERTVPLPVGADIADTVWSPDGSMVAFTNTRADTVDLWLLDVATAKARKIAGGVNPIFAEPSFMPDGRTILYMAVPEDRGAMPSEPLTPVGPAIQEAAGGQQAQTRTYQDLLSDPHDEAMFDWLATSQIMTVDITERRPRPRPVGEPAVWIDASPSPDGKYLLTERLVRPYSYEVPWSRFPRVTEVRTPRGDLVHKVFSAPLADALPVQGVPVGPRRIEWHPTAPSTILYAEALDGGDPKVKTDERDRLMALSAPFDGTAQEIARFEDRYYGFNGLEGDDDILAGEYDRDTREWRVTQVDVLDGTAPRVVEFRNVQDDYNDPGDPLMTWTVTGKRVIRVDDGAIFLTGRGASPDGDRPFLRRRDMETLQTTELWRNTGEEYESVVDVLSEDGSSFLTYYESPTNPGNYRVHDGTSHEGGDPVFVTDFPDPHPELTGIRRELITYDRGDGVPLSATLLLPPEYEEGDTLPVVVWAYPREYNNAATAGQVRGSNYRFTRISGTSPRLFLTQGYAVMENATMPVVGPDPETVNDTFIEQIVAAGQAAVDETVRRGFGDGERVGIAGHSYGAFMTAHLLARSDIFRAGIARSGAYNRTLTPFGFQAERRTFWESPETYYRLSPFMAADKINEPMLMIHGMKDNNSGTYPMQSERMFAAIKGNGGTVRLVMLPHESHGYRGRESVLHTLAESFDWFDTYVKGEVPRGAAGRQ